MQLTRILLAKQGINSGIQANSRFAWLKIDNILGKKRDRSGIYANQKMGTIYWGIVDHNPGQRMRKQSKHADSNKHTCSAKYYCYW